ncbi:hypothetical protein GCM10022393_03660 [Aquimarina addita]|uniref:Secretion system C-terminal sorting domain-containing protein n=1 Tax=Aquimarina addita TaxID=870485 RepID=A0ABP7X949_9FLAO
MKQLILYAIFLSIALNQLYPQTTIGLTQNDTGTLNDGYVLFAPIGQTDTYLINTCGEQVKTWPSSYRPGQSCYILPDGNLLRTGNTNNTTFNAGGKGGIIEKIDWNGNVIWSYEISDATQCQHHDIEALPNGNILVIAWDSKTNTEAIAQGRDPSLVPETVWSEKVLEIEPVGTDGGTIVWQWNLWDHIVQEYDNTKPNFGVVNTNPQLIDLNYGGSATNSDWIHLNSIDYNAALDQIVLSSHEFSEIWIIDHSTTTEQASGSSGGNSGKGGDLLYRWGNPLAYNQSGASAQLFRQHDARWIQDGFPYENQIIIFNNGNGRPGGNYTTVDIINPPVDGFNYTSTLPFLPASPSYIYNEGNPNNLYSQNISGSELLSNGNILICDGPQGTFTEVNSSGTTVWTYINPAANSGIMTQGETPSANPVFRANFYPDDYIGFAGHTLTAIGTIENTNSISDDCNVTLSEEENIFAETIAMYPNPANDFIYITNSNAGIRNIRISNSSGQLLHIKSYASTVTEISIPVDHYTNGLYFIEISDDKSTTTFTTVIDH